LALILYNVHPPRFMALSQFSPYILTLEKQGYAVFAPKPLCISKELRQRRASPGRDDIEALALRILDSNLPHLDSEIQPRRDRFQKAAFLCRRFIEYHAKTRLFPEDFCQHQSWKPRSTAKVDEGMRGSGGTNVQIVRASWFAAVSRFRLVVR